VKIHHPSAAPPIISRVLRGRARRGVLVTGWVLAAALVVVSLVTCVWLAWIYATLPDVRRVPPMGAPAATPFMREEGCAAPHDFVPLEDISPMLVCAVVRSEDRRFFRHQGVDWRAFDGAVREWVRAGEIRSGGSSIPMQLARNLFLSRDRTASRKARELALAPRLVEWLGRSRVLELYLNVAEWAPCVYGVGDAARYWLGHDARRIDLFEATLLSILLTRPRTAIVPDDAVRVAWRQGLLLQQLYYAGLISPEQLRAEQVELDRSWRVLARRRDADDLRAALHERRGAAMHAFAPTGETWLAVECGRLR
jgi:monofunctional glycosyltransferase